MVILKKSTYFGLQQPYFSLNCILYFFFSFLMVIILSDSQSNLPESFISDYIKSENNISELINKYNLLQ